MKQEKDTIFVRASRLYTWNVYKDGSLVAVVQSDTAGHACDWVCRTKWLSRASLQATLAR